MKRFWEKVDIRGEDECWLWKASKRAGYGAFKLNGEVVSAHRLAYSLVFGDPANWVCHRCDVRACCNPAHLFDGTRSDNMKDAFDKGRLGHFGGSKRSSFASSATGFKGVYVERGKYVARVWLEGKNVFIGYFEKAEEAADKFDAYVEEKNIGPSNKEIGLR